MNVGGGNDLEHRQLGERRERMGAQLERGRPGPGALQVDVVR